jgi:subtilisin family serine protease
MTKSPAGKFSTDLTAHTGRGRRRRWAAALAAALAAAGMGASCAAEEGEGEERERVTRAATAPATGALTSEDPESGLQIIQPVAAQIGSHGAALYRAGRPVPGQYIVVLRPEAARLAPSGAGAGERARATAAAMSAEVGGEVLHAYDAALLGFAARMSDAAARRLLDDPRVAYVEEDGLVEPYATQTSAPWGLDRIDQRARPLNGNHSYHGTGAGVHAYVIDTGIRLTHSQFAGRIGAGFDAVTPGGNAADCHGHGTAVAGVIGGTTYGAAKAVTLHPVRVLSCTGTGTTSGVISGINWVAANRVLPAVANMSLGGAFSTALNAAVNGAINAGVTFSAAAGSSSPCSGSPASVPAVLTSAMSSATDVVSTFGSCIDLYAPGAAIPSAGIASDTAVITLTGNSMAAPHVAGVAALYLQRVPTATPAQVAARVIGAATEGVLSGSSPPSPNRLLHNGLQNISLRASSLHFVVAEGGGGNFVAADRLVVGPAERYWDRFDVEDLNGGALANGDPVHLRAANGSYVVAEGGGGGAVNANRVTAGAHETFTLINAAGFPTFNTGDPVALQAANGQFVSAVNGGGVSGSGSVLADGVFIGAWEAFQITLY